MYKSGKTLLKNDVNQTSIEIFQTDYKKVSGQHFPNKTKAEIISKKDVISLILNYQKVKINTAMDYSFNIPEGYSPYE